MGTVSEDDDDREDVLLLMLMVPSSIVKHDKMRMIKTVPGRHRDCFNYDVMEGQVTEVNYWVINREQNTETTINFFWYSYSVSKKFDNVEELNRKPGGIRSTVAGNYKFCFENISPEIKDVAFEVVMKGELVEYDDDDNADSDRVIIQVCQDIALLVGKFLAVCVLCLVFFWLSNLYFKQKQQEKSEGKNNRRKRWKKDRRQQNSPLNVKTVVTYSPDILDIKTQSGNTKEVKIDYFSSERNNSKNDDKNRKNQLKCCGMIKNGNMLELDCSANCHYRFHLSCSHESLKAVSKKSLTGQESCLTPDCWGRVTSLVFKQQNGKVFRTLKLDPGLKRVVMNVKKKTQTSSTTYTSPRKNFTVLKKNVQPIVAQDADIRHLEKEAKVVKKILVSEDESRNLKKLKKRSVRNIKNIQRIHIDPIPIIQRKSKEFIKKDQILKLLKNVLIGESNFNEVIAKFLNEKGMISRRSIPIIMEEVLNSLEMKQIITEENVMESMDVKHEVIEEQDICAICIDILEDEVEIMDCTHKYHHDCISEWMTQNPVCPVCRASLKPASDFPPLLRNS